MKKIIFGAAFIVAIGGALATNALNTSQNLDPGDGYSRVNGICTLVHNAPEDCNATNLGAICSNFYSDDQCNLPLRKPQ